MHDPIDDDDSSERVPAWIERTCIAILFGFMAAMVFAILERYS
jgi:hypothetical protein